MPHLNEIDRARITAYLERDRKSANLAAEFRVGANFKKWEYERNIKRITCSGRSKATDENQDRQLINFFLQNPINTAANAINETHLSSSRSTVFRIRIRQLLCG
jgi:hypothetical protein